MQPLVPRSQIRLLNQPVSHNCGSVDVGEAARCAALACPRANSSALLLGVTMRQGYDQASSIASQIVELRFAGSAGLALGGLPQDCSSE